LIQYTEKQNLCNRKFDLCSNRPKTVLSTDLSVALTENALVKIGKMHYFFPEKLSNFYLLQHPEFSTKLAKN
jgi:hypothetical protein